MSASVSSYDLPHHGLSYSDRTLPTRRPASLSGGPRSSTASVRRHHRTARSSHGGSSSHQSQNEFPIFSLTGDVEILIKADGQERRYLLHRLILAQNSGFFAASTSDEWRQDSAARPGSATRSPAALTPATAARTSTKELVRAGDESKTLTVREDDSDQSRSGQERSLQRTGSGALTQAVQSAPPMQSTFAQAGGFAPPSLGQRPPMLRYELDWGEGGDDAVPMLVQKHAPSSIFGGGDTSSTTNRPSRTKSKPPLSSNPLFRSINAMQTAMHLPTFSNSQGSDEEPSDTIRDYDNMFRIFYNYAPSLDNFDITEAYIQSKTLLALADLYDSLEVVGPRVDHHLLTFQSRLWKQVAKYPPSYLKLGYAARSKAIFQEALAHVVGQWPQGAPQLKTLPEPVQELIEDKAADLDDLKARVEAKLFRLTLYTKHGERVNPSNAWWDYQAVAFFRHWLGENVNASSGPPAPAQQGQMHQGQAQQSQANGQLQSSQGRQRQQQQQQQLPPPPGGAQSHQRRPQQTNRSDALVPSAGGNLASSSLQNVSMLLASPLPQASGRVFRLLGMGGPAYLTHEECKRFIKSALGDHGTFSSSSREVVRKFERRIDEIKDAAREIVRPLLRNALELEIAGNGGLGYLTCTRVEEGEWPWL